jgi:ribose transport system substrate-binding protein
MTIDADLAEADRALRKTYLGTSNYDMGVLMAAPPGDEAGGIASGSATSPPTTSTPAPRDSAAPSRKSIDRLKGEGGWTEIRAARSSPTIRSTS